MQHTHTHTQTTTHVSTHVHNHISNTHTHLLLFLCFAHSVMQATFMLVMLLLGAGIWLLWSVFAAEPAVIIQSLFAEQTSTVRTWMAYLGGHAMSASVVNQASFGLSHKGAAWHRTHTHTHTHSHTHTLIP